MATGRYRMLPVAIFVGDFFALENTDNVMEDVILRWQRGRRDHVAMMLFDWLAGQHSAAVCHRPLLHVHVLLLLVLLLRRLVLLLAQQLAAQRRRLLDSLERGGQRRIQLPRRRRAQGAAAVEEAAAGGGADRNY